MPLVETQSRVAIRRAEISDAVQLATLFEAEVRLQQKLAGWFRLRRDIDWRIWVAAKLERPDSLILIASEHGRLVGFVEARLASRPGPRGKWAVIEEVYVAPEARRRGVATDLLDECSSRLRDGGVRQVGAGIRATNEASIEFFTRMGFEPQRLVFRREEP